MRLVDTGRTLSLPKRGRRRLNVIKTGKTGVSVVFGLQVQSKKTQLASIYRKDNVEKMYSKPLVIRKMQLRLIL